MKDKTTKRRGVAAKLIPATCMLLVSATALVSSTYAWFTMSREVEVQNIKLTATVPEDLQLSLGHLQYVAGGTTNVDQSTAKNYGGLAANQGILKSANSNAADDGNVQQPETGTDAISMLDWSNTADISEYYRLGKIIPASSKDGQNIYFTPDASGVGKTVKGDANYYQAANITTAFKWKDAVANTTSPATYADDGTGDSAATKLHAITNTTRANDKWNDGVTAVGTENTYTTATAWNDTNDDGYYVDIPVWFRSSAKETINLSVDAYVTTNSVVDDDDLYLAARVAVLYKSSGGTNTQDTSSNLLRVRKDSLSGPSIVDYMYTTNSTGDAVDSTGTAASVSYADAVEYTGTGIIPVAAATNNSYGAMTKAIIRVWLEGEDPNCWNQNAGQNFNICLKFCKDDLSDAGTNTYPTTAIDHSGTTNGQYGANSTTQSLSAGARAKVNIVSGSHTDNLEFTYEIVDSTGKWTLTAGSFNKLEGYTYSYNSATINTSDDIATQLLSTVTDKSTADATLTTAISITGSTGSGG